MQSSDSPPTDVLIFVVEACPEGGFTARAVGHSVFTEGETLELLQVNIRSAVACHFEENAVPALISLRIGEEQVVLKP